LFVAHLFAYSELNSAAIVLNRTGGARLRRNAAIQGTVVVVAVLLAARAAALRGTAEEVMATHQQVQVAMAQVRPMS